MRGQLILALLLALFGSAGARAAREPKTRANAKPAFKITISTPTTTVKAGSPVVVSARIENISDRDMNFVVGPGPRKPMGFIVLDSDGRPVPQTPNGIKFYSRGTQKQPSAKQGSAAKGIPGEAGSVIGFTVKPGKTIGEKSQDDLSKWWDFSKPGKYTIQAEDWDRASKSFVKSNTITLTVTP